MKSSVFGLIAFIILSCLSCQQGDHRKVKSSGSRDGFYTFKEQYRSFSRKTRDSLEQFFPGDFSGTVLIYSRGSLYKKAIGFADAQRKIRMKEDDIFQLASASKPLTSVAVMQLVEKGLVALDSPVQNYLNDFPYPGIRVRDLLTHRSGLANYLYFTDTLIKDKSHSMDNEEFYRFMSKCKPKPYLGRDVSFSYCNTNFALLACLIERVSKLKFPVYMEQHVFKPAGMRSSFYFGHKPQHIRPRVLTGRYEQVEYKDPYPPDGVLGDKSLFSNVEDMFYFFKALKEGRLMKDSLMRSMFVPSFGPNIYGGSYGLGFRLQATSSGLWAYHNGWWRGFWTSFWMRHDLDICLVILTNNKHSSHVDKKALAEFLAGRLK